jgi:hypothetical protein
MLAQQSVQQSANDGPTEDCYLGYFNSLQEQTKSKELNKIVKIGYDCQ